MAAPASTPLTEANPHLRQFLSYYGVDPPRTELYRPLEDADAELHYTSRKGLEKTTIAWGQRKLAITMIEFLTLFSYPGDVLVYAGAAPGTNIKYIAELFPEVTFELYDPRPFDPLLKQSRNILTYQQYFDDVVAQQYAGFPNILFMSDIRTGNEKHTTEEFEERVWEDMLMQQRWYDIMMPRKAMLKFRLPYTLETKQAPDELEYLDGVVLAQPWAKQTSTECRLIPNGGRRMWRPKEYEDKMFQHNTYKRVLWYPHDVVADGIDHCFDCASEVAIFKQYTIRFGGNVAELIKRLSNVLSRGRFTLATYKGRVSEN
jgi:hypothetical protein